MLHAILRPNLRTTNLSKNFELEEKAIKGTEVNDEEMKNCC